MRTALEVLGLGAAYGDQPVLQGVDLKVPQGSLMAIVGPNGAGKSTLLKTLLALHPLKSGEVRFTNPKGRAGVAYVPQRSAVDWDFPTDALDVVLMGLYREIGWFRRPSTSHRARAHEALERVGMAEFAQRHIAALSGGQQQRVFLARALVQEAEVYLLDEPFAGVDAVTEDALVQLLQRLSREGKTALVVHHDLDNVRDIFDHVALLNGQVVAAGPVEQVFTPEAILKAYGGRMAFVKA